MPAPIYTSYNSGIITRSTTKAVPSLTFSVVVPAGSNFMMASIAGVMQSVGIQTGPTFNSVGMTKYLSIYETGYYGQYIYYLPNPTVGTYNFNVSFANSTYYAIGAVVSVYSGVDLDNPFYGTATTGVPSGYSYTTPINSALDCTVFSTVQMRANNSGHTTSVDSPAAYHAHRTGSCQNSDGTWTGKMYVASAYRPGAAGSSPVVWRFPTGLSGTVMYHNVNLRGKPAGRSQAVWF